MPTDIPSPANLKRRDRLLRTARAFFHERDFLEVETPARIPAPAQEEQIDAPPAGTAWLRPSPELQMKRLLASGLTRLFQIGPCFREGERGRCHNPEFTLLEWYRASADAWDILDDCQALVQRVVTELHGDGALTYQGTRITVSGCWPRLTVREAFLRWAGWDPVVDYDADRFDHDLVEKVEPSLPHDRPVVLYDYPAAAAALARLRPDQPGVAERWELYLGGIELANAYSELTDAAAQRARFVAAADWRRRHGRAVYPLDEAFLAALADARLPPCGGIALGIDRLAMLLCDAASIDEVRAFCPPIGAPW